MATTQRYPFVSDKFPHMLHGGDYNPDQWIKTPEVWDEDIRLMKEAHVNAPTLGVFSWSQLEPEEGVYTFDWLDRVMDKLADNGLYAVLSTPSAAQPAWMSEKYPEVLRVNWEGQRQRHHRRVNYCLSSPLYRDKLENINRQLAERYGDHPALLLWHVGNEYGGQCHCEACVERFRKWLEDKYGSLEAVNDAWWSRFWSHRMNAWSQVHPFHPELDAALLDWKRFGTDLTIEFMQAEMAPLRELTPKIPCTANFHGKLNGLDYNKMARHVDIISWDAYPCFHDREDMAHVAMEVGIMFDFCRSAKGGQPWLLMESTPSITNMMPYWKLKRPGVHRLASLQAVAHGSDSVQYFQWRAGRGGLERYHGAVVRHTGENANQTRVFKDVQDVGATLQKFDAIAGTTTKAPVAILYDWENTWALEAGHNRASHDMEAGLTILRRHYEYFWRNSIPVDIVHPDSDLSQYKLVVAPRLFVCPEERGRRLESYVAGGGHLVVTFWSGNMGDTLLHGYRPGPLRQVLGLWCEDLDALYPDEEIALDGVLGEHRALHYCDLVHLEGATPLMRYASEYYEGETAVSRNDFGAGTAFYIACEGDYRFYKDLYRSIDKELELPRVIASELPDDVTATQRTDGKSSYIFLMNFGKVERTVYLGTDPFYDVENGEPVLESVKLSPYGVRVLRYGTGFTRAPWGKA